MKKLLLSFAIFFALTITASAVPPYYVDKSGNITANSISITNGWVTPEMFGGKADGITDSTAAFNIAVNMGLPVKLKAGIYLANVVHTSGFPIIQGAGMAVTYIKSYSATGYAWTESQVSAGWNTNLVMNDLSILGTGSRNGFVFGDPTTYSTDINYAGRCVFNRVSFQGCVIGFNKPWGNTGNIFNRCLFAGNSYGYYSSESAAHPMNAHEDIFNECIFMTNTLAAIYSNGISSTGQLVFNQGVFQENQGFAIFADNYYIGYIPLRINNVWFEQNALNANTTIRGTSYTTRDIYLKDVDYALIDGSMLANVSRELVNSSLRETNCNYNGETAVIDATSTLIQDNVNTWGPATVQGGEIRQSVANTTGGFGASYGETWNIPPRIGIVGGYTRKGGASYTGTAGVTTFPFNGTGVVNASCVADGVIYATAAELTIPAGYTLADNGANGSAAWTNGKWYVWSIDVKLTTTQKPTTIQFQNGSDSLNRTFHQLLTKDKWVTIGGIIKAVGAGTVYVPYIVNSSANPVTLRMSAAQVVEFTNKADAISYFNARLYSHI